MEAFQELLSPTCQSLPVSRSGHVLVMPKVPFKELEDPPMSSSGCQHSHALSSWNFARRESAGPRPQLKTGRWTAEEDEILLEYVKAHGKSNWNRVQHFGLARSGKSCRLRYENHLKNDLRKGKFTPAEVELVFAFQKKLGNKWAQIAKRLPGRTDNDIKNLWNTRVRKRSSPGSSRSVKKVTTELHMQKDAPSQPEGDHLMFPDLQEDEGDVKFLDPLAHPPVSPPIRSPGLRLLELGAGRQSVGQFSYVSFGVDESSQTAITLTPLDLSPCSSPQSSRATASTVSPFASRSFDEHDFEPHLQLPDDVSCQEVDSWVCSPRDPDSSSIEKDGSDPLEGDELLDLDIVDVEGWLHIPELEEESPGSSEVGLW